jgi:predicted Zn-dependent peptidase
LIVVNGPISERSVVKYLKLNFRSHKRRQVTEPVIWAPPVFRPQSLEKRIKLERYPSRVFWLTIGFPTKGLQESNRYALWLLSRILGEGAGHGSLLITELREKHGIGYHPQSSIDELSDAGAFWIDGNFVPEEFVKAVRLIQMIIRRLIMKSVDEDTLEAAKISLKKDLRSWSVDPLWAEEYIYEQWMARGQNWTTDSKIEPIESLFKKIDRVSADDIRKIARRIFTASRLFVAIIGPFTDKLEQQVIQILKDWDFGAKNRPVKKSLEEKAAGNQPTPLPGESPATDQT